MAHTLVIPSMKRFGEGMGPGSVLGEEEKNVAVIFTNFPAKQFLMAPGPLRYCDLYSYE